MPERTSITIGNSPVEYRAGLNVVDEIPSEILPVDAQALATREFIFGVIEFFLDLLGELIP